MQVFFLILFFCVYSCEADRRWNLTIALLFVLVPCFVHPCGLSSPCHVFGQCFCDLHPNNDTSIFLFAGRVKFHCMFFSVRVKILHYDKNFCPLDCMVAVADVGLLCWESWKRRKRGEIESQMESRWTIVTYEMRWGRLGHVGVLFGPVFTVSQV